jgi:hypothetical protein
VQSAGGFPVKSCTQRRVPIRSLRNRPQLADFLQSAPELSRRRGAHGSIRCRRRCLRRPLDQGHKSSATLMRARAMVWPRPGSRPRTMKSLNAPGPPDDHLPLGLYVLIARGLFHFSGAELYSPASPELPSHPLESAEYKGRQKFRSLPAGATMRSPLVKMFFGGALAQWPALATFCAGPAFRWLG